MPRRSRKHSHVNIKSSYLSKGLDLSSFPSQIHDESLTRAYNVWYTLNTASGLENRYGLERVYFNESPLPITDKIIKVYNHIDNEGIAHLLVVTHAELSDYDTLYELKDGQYTYITQLNNQNGLPPSIISFNGVLLIADGGEQGLLAWDKKGVQTIQDSPTKATVIISHADRVVCNSLTSPDSVFFSEPEQYDKWALIEGGNAVIIPAGFGEGMEINAFSSLYGSLIVSKVHKDEQGFITEKKMHLISTQGTTADWQAVSLSHTSSACSHDSMLGVLDKVYLIDTDGVQLIVPSPAGAYGDIAIDTKQTNKTLPLINLYLKDLFSAEVVYMSSLGQVWFTLNTSSTVKTIVYSLVNNAWSELEFPLKYNSICEIDNKIYIGGHDGRLYYLTATGQDWTEQGYQDIYSTIRTKLYEQMGGDIILKAVKLSLGRMKPSLLKIEAVGEDEKRYLVKEVNTQLTGSSDQLIYDANQKIDTADWKIYCGNAIVKQYFDYKANVRATGLYIQVRIVGGRVIINSISGLFAQVG